MFQRLPSAVCLCALVMACLLAGCGRGASQGGEVDLRLARDAYDNGYLLEAETAYERYLQADPQGRHRLEAWTRLVEICAGVKGDSNKAISLLEMATLEYSARPKENWSLLFRLGELYERRGQCRKAVETWTRCLDTANGDATRIVQAQLRMAVAERALGKTERAVDLLAQAEAKAPEAAIRARVIYELAQTYALTWNWPKAEETLKRLSAVDGAPRDTEILGVFLLADVCEAQGAIPRARQLLLSIKDTYPNPDVIVDRLATLGQRNESPAIAHMQPGGAVQDLRDAGSANVKMRRVRAGASDR